MITTTHSHQAWTNKACHVNITAAERDLIRVLSLEHPEASPDPRQSSACGISLHALVSRRRQIVALPRS